MLPTRQKLTVSRKRSASSRLSDVVSRCRRELWFILVIFFLGLVTSTFAFSQDSGDGTGIGPAAQLPRNRNDTEASTGPDVSITPQSSSTSSAGSGETNSASASSIPTNPATRDAVPVTNGNGAANGAANSSNATEVKSETATGDRSSSIIRNGSLEENTRLWLQGNSGVPVLTNITLQELRELQRSTNDAQQTPTTIEKLDVTVQVEEAIAQVTARYTIALGSNRGPAVVNLQLGTIQLNGLPQIADPAVRSSFRPLPQSGGYEWLVVGSANSSHNIQLDGETKVRDYSDQRQINIPLPLAITTVKVLLPSTSIDERVRPEDTLSREITDDGVLVTVRTRGGDFNLTWREKGDFRRLSSNHASSQTTFEMLDPQQPWTATTNLNFRWYGNDAEKTFRVQLPHGAQWRSYPTADLDFFRVTTIDATIDDEDTSTSAQPYHPAELLVENLDITAQQSVDLVLEWDWFPQVDDNDSTGTEVLVTVPEVMNVDKHDGTIDCTFPASFATVFQEEPGVSLIQQGRLTTVFGRQQMQFGFTHQEFDLKMSFRREQSLPTVRPTYRIHVDDNKLLLTAWYECSFDTARQQLQLGIIPGEWTIEENSARVLQPGDEPYAENGQVLDVRVQDDGTYAMNSRAPETGFTADRRVEQVWRFSAQRAWDPGQSNALEFAIPSIVRGRSNGQIESDHGSGVLLVTSSNDIVLQANANISIGLLVDSYSPQYQKYDNQKRTRSPLVYRFQSRGRIPTWVGKVDFLPQQVSFDQHCSVEVVPDVVQVRQEFEIRVANEALTKMRIAFPVDAKSDPQVFVNGALTTIQATGSASAAELEQRSGFDATATKSPVQPFNQWQIYELVGAPAILGPAKITVLTSVPWSPVAKSKEGNGNVNGGVANVAIPLAQFMLPANSKSVRQDWSLTNDLQFEVTANDSTTNASATSSTNRRQLRANELALQLQLRQRETMIEAPLVVRSSWLQTVVTSTQRRDRFVARVRSNKPDLQIELPPQGRVDKIAINGLLLNQLTTPQQQEVNSVTVSLPQTGNATEHVVEVFYVLPDSISSFSPIRMSIPKIRGAELDDRFYWQVVVPGSFHLAWSPSELTPEWVWQWSGWGWYRNSSHDQRSLEKWSGASLQDGVPRAANRYVMSGYAPGDDLEVRAFSRFVLWLPIGTLAISVTVLFLNVPVTRSFSTALAFAVVLISLGMLWPEAAYLVGQTAAASLILVALVVVTQWGVESRLSRRSIFSTRPPSYADSTGNFTFARSGRTSQLFPTGSSVSDGGERL